MSEGRMATPEDFNRHLMSVGGIVALGGYELVPTEIPYTEVLRVDVDPNQTGGDGGPHLRPEAGQFTRAALADGLKVLGTPKSEPSYFSRLWDQSVLEAQEQGPPFPLPKPPERAGQMQILPDRFNVTFDIDVKGIEDSIVTALSPFVGERLTEAVLADITRKAGEALKSAMGKGFNSSVGLPLPMSCLGPLGIDWKKEQAAIAEEARYQAEMQAKMQEETADDLRPEYDLKTLVPLPPEKVAELREKRAARKEEAKEAELAHARMDDDGGRADTTMYQRRDGFIQEFFAYETVGMTPAHVASCVKTDDPELMKALGDAIEQGRVVMDGDTVVSIDGVPVNNDAEFFRNKMLEGLAVPKSAFEVAADPVTEFTRDLMKRDGAVKQAMDRLREEDDPQPLIVESKK